MSTIMKQKNDGNPLFPEAQEVVSLGFGHEKRIVGNPIFKVLIVILKHSRSGNPTFGLASSLNTEEQY